MEKIIWTNDLDYDDWQEALEEDYPDDAGFNEQYRIDMMYLINNDDFEDTAYMLDKELHRPIIQYGTINLWNGRRTGYKWLKGTNLKNFLYEAVGDYQTYYIEQDDVKCEDTHHDGRNYYTYRILKEGYDKEDFEDYEYEHSFEEAVELMTEKLGPEVGKLIGITI